MSNQTEQWCNSLYAPMTAVLSEIGVERKAQIGEWGNMHDDRHDAGKWCDILADRVHMARRHARTNEADRVLYRKRLIQVAAIAVAAVEALDRKPKTIQEYQQTVIAAARRVLATSSLDELAELETAIKEHDAAVEQSIKSNVQRVTE